MAEYVRIIEAATGHVSDDFVMNLRTHRIVGRSPYGKLVTWVRKYDADYLLSVASGTVTWQSFIQQQKREFHRYALKQLYNKSWCMCKRLHRATE